MNTSFSPASLAAQAASMHADRADASLAAKADLAPPAKPVVDGVVIRPDRTTHADDSFAAMRAEVNRAKEAREENSGWGLFGAIFLGPLMGTQIGSAIGGAGNDQTQPQAGEPKSNNSVAALGAEASVWTAATGKPAARAMHAGTVSYGGDKDP